MADRLSFALNPTAPVEQRAAPSAAPVGVQGAQLVGGQSAGVAPVPDRTFEAIIGMGGKVLAPKVKEAQQEQFMQGVQRAMTGEALTEIVNDQPWYTQIFGPSAAAQGARAYTTQAAIASWSAQMESQMPKLAEQDPDAIKSMATGALKGFMTGDPAADGAITQAAVEQFAPLFKRHAKEHYLFLQNKAADAQGQSWAAQSSAYQSNMMSATATAEERKASGEALLAQLTPFGDQTEDSYNKGITKFLSNAMAAGEFHTVNLFRTTKLPNEKGEEVSLWDRVPVDMRRQLTAALPGMARGALDKAMPTYAVDLALLVNDTAQNPANVPARLQAFNAKVAEQTGVSLDDAQMIPPGSFDNIVGRILNAQDAAQRSAATAAANVDIRPALAQSLVSQPGALMQAMRMGNLEGAHVEKAMFSAYLSAPTPQARIALLNAHPEAKAGNVKDALQTPLSGAEFTSGIGQVAQVYAGLDQRVVGDYFDQRQREVLDRFTGMVRTGMPEVQAWQVANLLHPVARKAIPEKDKSAIGTTVRKIVESENEKWYGSNTLTDASLRLAEAMTVQTFDSNATTDSLEAGVLRAYGLAKGRGLTFLGHHAILSPANQDNAEVFGLVKGGVKETASAFDAIMDEKAKAMGTTLDNYIITRGKDRNGVAYFQVMANGDGRTTRAWTISSEDIQQRIVADLKQRINPQFQSPIAPAFTPQRP